MKIRSISLTLLTLVFSVSLCLSQQPAKEYLFELRGTVVDPEKVPYGAMPLQFEKDGFKKEAVSDANGKFSIKLPPGNYQVTTSDATSKTFKTFIVISEAGPNPTDFELIVELNKNWCMNCPEGKIPEVIK